MRRINIIRYHCVDSTNACMRGLAADGAESGTVVTAHRQSAGRGQRGNSWEAEPGKNLTFSILLRPYRLPANSQFTLSEAVAVSVAETIAEMLPPDAPEVEVKWPNDIYIGDKKICGILIENTLSGKNISYSIIGIGINVNQTAFLSDAPNPASMIHFTGRDTDLEIMLEKVCDRILTRCENLHDRRSAIHDTYLSRLWRRTGIFPFREPQGEIFQASIKAISDQGFLTLELSSGEEKTYAFKEIEAVVQGTSNAAAGASKESI